MENPSLNYKHWLDVWNNSIGNVKAYNNVNIIPWSKFKGTLNQCEVEILNIVNKESLNDFEIFRAIDLINQWGGKTSRMFYTKRKNQTMTSRELIMVNPNLDLYKKGIFLSKKHDYNAVDSFKMVNGIGASFMGKHASFWSSFNMVIIDNKIAGTLGFINPNKLLKNNTYEEFMNFINHIKNQNNIDSPVHVERSLFSFHNNYFDNENTKFKSKISDFTDLEYAIHIAEILNINVPPEIRDNFNKLRK